MRVVADSHALIWYVNGSSRLSRNAHEAMADAEQAGGLVVSVATFIDLWYVTVTTKAIEPAELQALRELVSSPDNGVELRNIDLTVTRAYGD